MNVIRKIDKIRGTIPRGEFVTVRTSDGSEFRIQRDKVWLKRTYGPTVTYRDFQELVAEVDEEYDEYYHGNQEYDEYIRPTRELLEEVYSDLKFYDPYERVAKVLGGTEMTEETLRSALIKLAYDRPEIRDDILPLVKEAAGGGLYEHLSQGAEKYLKDVSKELKKTDTFKNMGRAGMEAWDMWFENAQINVQPGFEDQYPDMYENPPVVSFIVTIFLEDWRNMRVGVALNSGFTRKDTINKKFLTGADASKVADFISQTVASHIELA